MSNLSAVGEECEVDLDCGGTLLCFSSEYEWVKTNFSSCNCNSWYGFRGDDCTEIGPETTVFIASLILTGGFALFSLFFSAKTLIIVFKIKEKLPYLRKRSGSGVVEVVTEEETSRMSTKKRSTFVSARKKKESTFNAMNTTSIFAFLGILTYLAFRISQLVLLLTPENLETRTEDGIQGAAKAHFLEINVDPYLIIVTGAFNSLSVLNLSLVWIDNVTKIQSFTVQNRQKIVRYKYFLLVLNILFCLVVILLPVALLTVVILFLLIVISILYIIAVRKLKELHKSFENTGRSSFSNKNFWLEKLVQRMSLARRRIVIGTLLAFIGGVFYTITSFENSWREYSPVGYPSAPMAGNEVMIFGLGFIQFACIWFLYQSAQAPVKGRKSSNTGRRTKRWRSQRKITDY